MEMNEIGEWLRRPPAMGEAVVWRWWARYDDDDDFCHQNQDCDRVVWKV